MRILVTGSRGQLGSEMQRILAQGRAEMGSIPSAYDNAEVSYVDAQELDITKRDDVLAYVEEYKPDLVINCAAFTNVDACETQTELAYAVNALGPSYLAEACELCGARFVHVSTDYVFSGGEPGERTEADPTGPVSAYGRTKLAGEELVSQACSRSFIVRTAWLYGYVGKNFVKTMLWLAKERGGMTVVADQWGNPTSANDLAYEILHIALTEHYGLYHITNKGTCSWFDFTQAILHEAQLDPKMVLPCTSEEYRQANPNSAHRPQYSSLDNAHLRATIGDEMRSWQDALANYMSNYDELAR